MKRVSDVPTQAEITENVEKSVDEMKEKENDLDEIARDVDTVRRTLESLDFSSTVEGSGEIESKIEEAEEVTVDVFDREDEQLDQMQQENEEYQNEIDDRSKSTESDLGKISDASQEISTQETSDRLREAKESAIREIDFLAEQIERARQARDASEQIQNVYGTQVKAGKER